MTMKSSESPDSQGVDISEPVNILLLEDDPHDVELIRHELKKGEVSFELAHVSSEKEFLKILKASSPSSPDVREKSRMPDVILADYRLPDFDGLRALELRGLHAPHIPFVLVSGRIGEELAIEALTRGATDYVLKDRLSRLPAVVKRAIEISRSVMERQKARKALAASEERYRMLFETSRDAIYITDSDGRFFEVNQSFLDLFGYSPEEIKVMHVFQIYPADSKKRELSSRLLEHESLLVKKDGGLLYCLVTTTPRLAADGKLLGYQGIIHDVTARKEMERAMFEAQKLESLGVLSGGVAHDFNNLITVIQGNAELAAAAIPKGNKAARFLEQIGKASHRSAELCRQLLAYAGKSKLVMEPLDMNSLLREVTELLHISISKSVVLEFKLEKNLPAVVGDATQLRQVILNLVVNASEAVGENPGTITVSTGVLQANRAYLNETQLAGGQIPEGEYVCFEVSDSGCGMEAETLKKIFDPFFTTKFTGRGLGLAAVLGIIRGHRGTLKVESQPGRGTKFKVLVPVAHQPAVPKAMVSAPSSLGEWRGKGTVLVVDDEESVGIMASQMVENIGFKAVRARNGLEALNYLRSPDNPEVQLVLLDMTMPHMSGDKVFHEIKKISPSTPVLLMSGYSEEQASAMFQNQALPGFIHKPFRLAALKEKVRSIVESASLA
jgi:two-component system, cell cycle sensor histidine kinase and response regulator CckA